MDWREFHAVSRTSRTFRNIFQSQELKDIALARFVPGYTKESPQSAEKVPVSLQDLEVLSESFPCHSMSKTLTAYQCYHRRMLCIIIHGML
jgi:hypothetical protein